MAPRDADTGRSPQTSNSVRKNSTSALPRIIPAVPLAFSRPITSKNKPVLADITNKDAVEAQPIKDEKRPASSKAKPSANNNGSIETSTGSQEEASPFITTKPQELPAQQTPSQNGTPHTEQNGLTLRQSRRISTSNTRVPHVLPPPFYPSENRSTPTPTSATSSTAHANFYNNNVNIQHPRPTPNSLTFGGFPDSSNTSPAPPGSMMPFQLPPHPPSGFAPPNYGPPFFPTHSHHLSDPHAGTMYPMGPPPNLYAYRREQHPPSGGIRHQPYLPPDAVPYSSRQQEPFFGRPPFPPPNGVNNVSRSPSQASSRAPDHEGSRHGYGPQPSDLLPPNGVNPHFQNKGPDLSPLFQLRDWLLSQFGNPELADYILEISHSADIPPSLFPVHGLVLGRIPVLHSLMMSYSATPATPPGPKRLQLAVSPRYFSIESYAEALKSLYGGPLLSSAFLDSLPPLQKEIVDNSILALAQEHMVRALAYASAGHHLGIGFVVNDGIETAVNGTRWDNIEKALDFALDEGDESMNASPNARNSMDGSFVCPRSPLEAHKATLAQGITDFITQKLPRDFEFIPTAPELQNSPRLPLPADTRSMKHRHRLSQIRFGELAPDSQTLSKFIATLTSSILLSLPFNLLKQILESPALENQWGQAGLSTLAKEVIGERETRRLKILSQKAALAQHPLWSNSELVERIEYTDQTPRRFFLVSTRQAVTNGS